MNSTLLLVATAAALQIAPLLRSTRSESAPDIGYKGSIEISSADPSLKYADVFGSASVLASAVDAEGNVYLTGTLSAATLRVTKGAFQTSFASAVCAYAPGPHGTAGPPIPCTHGFVAKVDRSGTRLLYATYLGGNLQDAASSIAVDGKGFAYVAGSTSSSDFPVTPGAFSTSGSGFLTKLTPDGTSAAFSTRLPSSVTSVALDDTGNIYLAGNAGPGFPTTPGAFQSQASGNTDVYVMKLSGAGDRVVYSTLIGGTFQDSPAALAVDRNGNAFVAGITASTPYFSFLAGPDYVLFPTTAGAYASVGGHADVFITKLNADGNGLVFSSVFGGSGDDSLTGLAIDSAGAAYFAGYTPYSPDFPTTPGAFQRNYGGGFTGKLTADGSRLEYSTYLGTGRADSIGRLTVGKDGRVHVSGVVDRPDFPTTPDADRPCFTPLPAGYFSPTSFYATLSSTGVTVVYGTYAGNVLALDSEEGFYSTSDTRILRRIDTLFPAPGIRCVANAASRRQGPVATGEVVSLFGFAIGPDEPVTGLPDSSGKMPTTLSGTRVLVDGIAAPLLYASKHQINAVVPFSAGASARATIEVNSSGSGFDPVSIAVADAVPGAFTLDGSGSGRIVALNEDGSINGPDHPAMIGSAITFWLTGFGAMQPTPTDGLIAPGALSKPLLYPVVRLGGQPAEVLYCGESAGRVEGIIEMKIRIPALQGSGDQPLAIQSGEANLANAPYVTISVR